MEDLHFVNFDINKSGEKQLQVTTRINSSDPISSNISDSVKEIISTWREGTETRIRAYRKSDSNIEREDARIGSKLLNLLFPDEFSRGSFQTICDDHNKKIVINIETRDPYLSNLPWEACVHSDWKQLEMNPPRNDVVVVRSPFPFYNHWPASEPVKILIGSSSPLNRPIVNDNKEYKAIQLGLDSANLSNDSYELQRVPEMTSIRLHENIRKWQPNIIHLISHGSPGTLEIENSEGESILVTGRGFSDALRTARSSLCLMVTTACLSSQSNESENLPGLSEFFINHVPISIGMQLSISQDIAIEFSREFYYALASSYSVLDAFVHAREKIIQKRPGSPEWIAPVLYRGNNQFGSFFSPSISASIERIIKQIEEIVFALRRNDDSEELWGDAKKILNQIDELLLDSYRKKKLQLSSSQKAVIEKIADKLPDTRKYIIDIEKLLVISRDDLELQLKYDVGGRISKALEETINLQSSLQNFFETF